jgi:hypothetical protein
MKIVKCIWAFIGTILVVIGCSMVFGPKGAAEFLQDMKLRLEVQSKVLEDEIKKNG